MGAPNKLLVLLEGAPVVAHTVAAALASRARHVVVVTGYEGDAVRAVLAGRAPRLRFVDNPSFEEGMASSLRAGVEALPPEVEAVLVCLGDMPWVARQTIDTLIASFAEDRDAAAICAPVHAGLRGNPVLFGSRHFPALRSLTGHRGARPLLDANSASLRAVTVDDPGIHRDVDRPEQTMDAAARTTTPAPTTRSSPAGRST